VCPTRAGCPIAPGVFKSWGYSGSHALELLEKSIKHVAWARKPAAAVNFRHISPASGAAHEALQKRHFALEGPGQRWYRTPMRAALNQSGPKGNTRT
jgi:hypothetical protein